MYKKLYFIGFVIYAILLVFSIHFAKERIIFIDMASNLFYILANKGFYISHYRFGDVVSQLFPLVAVKTGLSLSAAIVLYSAGYIVYSAVAYFVCGTILQRYDFALIILLQNLLFSSDTFYVLSQLPQSVTLIVLIFAMLDGKQWNANSFFSKIIAVILLITVVFFHPAGIFAMFFLVGYFVLNRQPTFDQRLLYALPIIYIAALAIKIMALRTPYESHSMSGLKNLVTQFPDYFTLYSNQRFLAKCLTKYYWIPVLFAVITATYIRTKNWKKLWFFVVMSVGYLGLVNICYPFKKTPDFYIENIYLPLSIFLSFPFVLEVLPGWKNKSVVFGVVMLISISGLIRIYNTHSLYTARLDYYRKILSEFGEKKVLLNAGNTNMDLVMMAWGTPFEFLLLSESERGKPASIIIDEYPKRLEWAGGLKTGLLVNWNVIQYKSLPRQYFNFTDTTSGYKISPNP